MLPDLAFRGWPCVHGHTVAALIGDDRVALWDLGRGSGVVRTLAVEAEGHNADVFGGIDVIALSRTHVAASSETQQAVYVWDRVNWQQLRVANSDWNFCLYESELAYCHNGSVYIYDLQSQTQTHNFKSSQVGYAWVASSGSALACVTYPIRSDCDMQRQQFLDVYDLSTHTLVRSVALSDCFPSLDASMYAGEDTAVLWGKEGTWLIDMATGAVTVMPNNGWDDAIVRICDRTLVRVSLQWSADTCVAVELYERM